MHELNPMLHRTKEDFNNSTRISSPSKSTISLELHEDFNACNLTTVFDALSFKRDSKVYPAFNASKMNVENNLSKVTSNLHNSFLSNIEDSNQDEISVDESSFTKHLEKNFK